jgi:rRNA-processing protein FCF1
VLAKNDKKIKKEVAIVEQILKNNKVKTIDSLSEDVDSELVKYSKEGYVIATNDKQLRDRIRNEKGKTIYVRSLTYVDVEDLLEQ